MTVKDKIILAKINDNSRLIGLISTNIEKATEAVKSFLMVLPKTTKDHIPDIRKKV